MNYLNITLPKLEELYKKGYDLNIIYYLKMIDDGLDPIEISLKNDKLNHIWSSIIRKGLVSECTLTAEGKALLDFMKENGDKVVTIKRKKPPEEPFLRWWSAFPGTDTFEYKGKTFTGTRALKAKKEDCKTKFNKILDEGEYTIDELIAALQLEISQKKESSYKTGANSLKYMHNSLTYLNQRDFEPFIELVKKGHKSVEENKITSGGGVEI
jgi:hypothetical protein